MEFIDCFNDFFLYQYLSKSKVKSHDSYLDFWGTFFTCKMQTRLNIIIYEFISSWVFLFIQQMYKYSILNYMSQKMPKNTCLLFIRYSRFTSVFHIFCRRIVFWEVCIYSFYFDKKWLELHNELSQPWNRRSHRMNTHLHTCWICDKRMIYLHLDCIFFFLCRHFQMSFLFSLFIYFFHLNAPKNCTKLLNSPRNGTLPFISIKFN